MLGYYGSTLGQKNPEVVKKAIQHSKKEPISGRPADLLRPEWDQLRGDALALSGCNGSDEDVLTYAMFPGVAPKFFPARSQGPKNLSRERAKAPAKPASKPAPAPAPAQSQLTEPVSYVVTLNGKSHNVTVAPAS